MSRTYLFVSRFKPGFYVGVRITDWKQKEVDEQTKLEELGEYSPITQEEMNRNR